MNLLGLLPVIDSTFCASLLAPAQLFYKIFILKKFDSEIIRLP